jgi:uncharacterized protein (TIGR00661 family)
MARILYGVAGEGFGHSSRSELLGRRLLEAGHDVLFAASRKSLRYLRQCFPERVEEVYGLSFVYRQGRVRPLSTTWQNLKGYRQGFRTNRHLFGDRVRSFKPDLVISDFEPFSAWWAWRHRMPCVSIDHEHMLTLCKLDSIPGHRWDRFLANLVTRGYHTWADAYMIPNFFKAPLKSSRAVLTAPVVREVVRNMRPWSGEHIVCYSTDSEPVIRRRFTEVFRQFPQQRFFVYGFDQDAEEGNVLFKKTSTTHFIHDLAGCRGVISTAGFSLISECLYFKKRMLLSPMASQYEQIVNAYYIDKGGLGVKTRQLCPEDVNKFLKLLEEPFPTNGTLLLPDNERYFETVEETFRRIGLPVGLRPAAPGQTSSEDGKGVE